MIDKFLKIILLHRSVLLALLSFAAFDLTAQNEAPKIIFSKENAQRTLSSLHLITLRSIFSFSSTEFVFTVDVAKDEWLMIKRIESSCLSLVVEPKEKEPQWFIERLLPVHHQRHHHRTRKQNRYSILRKSVVDVAMTGTRRRRLAVIIVDEVEVFTCLDFLLSQPFA